MEEKTKVTPEEFNDEEFDDEFDDEFFDEADDEEVEKPKGKFSKLVSGVKKHGKKIAVGTVVTIGGLVGYAILKAVKSGNSDVEYLGSCDSADDVIDVTFDEIDE